jgi:hypothetical protein
MRGSVELNLKGIGLDNMEYIHVDIVIDIRVSHKARNFLIGSGTVSFSRITLLHGYII